MDTPDSGPTPAGPDWLHTLQPGVDGLSRVEIHPPTGTLIDDELAALWRFQTINQHPVGHPHPGWHYQIFADPRATGLLVQPLPMIYADPLGLTETFYRLARLVVVDRTGRIVVGTISGRPAADTSPVEMAAEAVLRAEEWRDLRKTNGQ